MQNAFSFNLSDLDYWLIKRKDGEMVKYVVSKQVAQKQGIGWPNLHSSH